MTEIELKVRAILYHDWNPCGVSGLPDNEYDTYVPWVADLVEKNDQNISLFLGVLQDHYFCGLGPGEEDRKRIAIELKKIKL